MRPPGVTDVEDPDWMAVATRTFRTTTAVANHAVKKRAAQDLTVDLELVEKLLARSNRFTMCHQ